MLLVPVGFGATCTGHLALGRKDPEQPWTSEEAQVATEIGADLGRAVHNAEAFAHDQRLAADLRALGIAKSRLIGNVSHELRGPLTTIVGHLELLDSAPGLSEEARQCVDAMTRNGDRLHRMVEDLTLLARVGDPAATARCEPVDVGLVAREVVDMIEVTAERAGIEVRLDVASQPPAVLGDRTEIDQALCNLLSNAVKYGRRGGHVELGLDVVDGEAVISCRDDGLGISERRPAAPVHRVLPLQQPRGPQAPRHRARAGDRRPGRPPSRWSRRGQLRAGPGQRVPALPAGDARPVRRVARLDRLDRLRRLDRSGQGGQGGRGRAGSG